MSSEQAGEDPDEALVAAILDAEREAELAELIRSPARVEALIEQNALGLDFDLALDLSGGLAALGFHHTARLVALTAFADANAKVMAAGQLALGWIELSRGKHRKALAAIEDLAGNTDIDVFAEAAYLRGVILESRGRHAQAAVEYERAIGMPRRKSAGQAALSLAEMLSAAGDDEQAVEVLAVALECGVAHVVPQAALQLALIRDRSGDVEGAIPLYREAMESGLPSAAPRGAFHLGEILLGAGTSRVPRRPSRRPTPPETRNSPRRPGSTSGPSTWTRTGCPRRSPASRRPPARRTGTSRRSGTATPAWSSPTPTRRPRSGTCARR
ncbi:hypothetical protein GCM10023195_29970 [Actinoallomurus liliacearum]|uniref:Tetratrico peptide repeat group 5 domain-containing protein n=1 Tax=Actinoallomurus liliacearum TaxID=1080073 RepID=A0ABP8TKD6_9ACTN